MLLEAVEHCAQTGVHLGLRWRAWTWHVELQLLAMQVAMKYSISETSILLRIITKDFTVQQNERVLNLITVVQIVCIG